MVSVKHFDTTDDGKEVRAFTIKKGTLEVEICEYGGTITKIVTPDKDGNLADVNLSRTSVQAMKETNLGATIGRHAGRIFPLEIEIAGKSYTLSDNTGKGVNLHGGKKGLGTRIMTGEVVDDTVVMKAVIPHLDDEFPGELSVAVVFSITEENGLRIDYKAVSDAETIINLTNHAYFNLGGHDSGSVEQQQLWVNSDQVGAHNDHMIYEEVRKVEGTVFDFTVPKTLGEAMNSDDAQIRLVNGGVDHMYFLGGSGMRKVAELSHPQNGRVLEVYTTEPCVQVYTSNYLNIDSDTKSEKGYGKHGGICLETQNTPNTVNIPWLKSSVFKREEVYSSATEYRFSVKK